MKRREVGSGMWGCWLVAGALLLATAMPAEADRVRHVLRTAPRLVGLPTVAFDERYQNAVDVILEQAIRNLPLHPSASSAYTWRRNPDTGDWERTSDEVSPFFVTERGPTMGEGLLNASVTWGYYRVECSSGCKLGSDPLPLSISAAAIDYQARTELLYTIGTFNFTYGVTDDLDVNVAIPIATLDADLDVTRRDRPGGQLRSAARTVESANISDMMVRAKYRLFDTTTGLGAMIGAAGLRVRLPTGDPSRGLGTGYGEIGPYGAVSADLLEGWLDSHLDAGVDAGIGDLRRSSGHYSWAVNVHAPRGDDWWTRLAVSADLIGRSEFASLREPPSVSGRHVSPQGFVDRPYLCLDPDRHDYLDLALGLRVHLVDTIVLSLGVFKALNNAGIRATEWSPVAAVEGTF